MSKTKALIDEVMLQIIESMTESLIKENERLRKEASDQSTEIQMNWFSPIEGKGMKMEIKRQADYIEELEGAIKNALHQIDLKRPFKMISNCLSTISQ
jgi:hypothetical protein